MWRHWNLIGTYELTVVPRKTMFKSYLRNRLESPLIGHDMLYMMGWLLNTVYWFMDVIAWALDMMN